MYHHHHHHQFDHSYNNPAPISMGTQLPHIHHQLNFNHHQPHQHYYRYNNHNHQPPLPTPLPSPGTNTPTGKIPLDAYPIPRSHLNINPITTINSNQLYKSGNPFYYTMGPYFQQRPISNPYDIQQHQLPKFDQHYVQPGNQPQPIQSNGKSIPNLQWYNMAYTTDAPIHSKQIWSPDHPQKFKLPPLSNFFSFQKPMVSDPLREQSKSFSYQKPIVTLEGQSKFFNFQRTIVCDPLEGQDRTQLKEKKNEKKPIVRDMDKSFKTNLNKYKVSKSRTFKPNTRFLSKITINEDLLIKHIKNDPEIQSQIDFSKEVQNIKLTKDKISKYVIMEFFFEILKFNDKRYSKFLIDNNSENRIELNIKFELETPVENKLKIIKIWLIVLKPTESSISQEKITNELTKYYSKFMEAPDYMDPKDDSLENEAEIHKPFRPIWRLGAKDELSIIDMKIDITYPTQEEYEEELKRVEQQSDTEEEGEEEEEEEEEEEKEKEKRKRRIKDRKDK